MCERIIERLPSMTALERQQLRQNCERACKRSADQLVIQEAGRIICELNALESRESRFLDRLPAARRIEYAFRRLPANDRERELIRILHAYAGASPQRVSAALGNAEDLTWLRQLCIMLRDRRHLIGVDAAQADASPPEADVTMVSPLIELDDEEQAIRLTSDALAAFCSIGYVDRRAA
jgi:hypothetical protein